MDPISKRCYGNPKIISYLIIIILCSCQSLVDFEYTFVLTGEVTNINDTSATFTGRITKHGTSDITESGFIWGVHSNDPYGIRVTNETTPKDTYSLVTNEKLFPNRTFYVRAFVETESSIIYGNEVSFESLDGEINKGKWSGFFSEAIELDTHIISSFIIDDITYFIFEDGSVYVFDHINKSFTYL